MDSQCIFMDFQCIFIDLHLLKTLTRDRRTHEGIYAIGLLSLSPWFLAGICAEFRQKLQNLFRLLQERLQETASRDHEHIMEFHENSTENHEEISGNHENHVLGVSGVFFKNSEGHLRRFFEFF